MNNTVFKTLEILNLIAESKQPMGVTTISRELGYAKSSVFDIVSTLQSENYLELAVPELKTYKLGLKAYQIGSKYVQNNDLYSKAHDALLEMSKQTGETAYFAIESNGFLIYLDKAEGKSPLNFSCEVGNSNYLHITGLGKAILAGYDDETVESIMKDKFVVRTKNTIMDMHQLKAELKTIRENGFSIDFGEDNELFRCVAAPIYNAAGKTIAAISLSIFYMDFDSKKEMIQRIVTNAALNISRKLGYLAQ